jgi:hypothetical protein
MQSCIKILSALAGKPDAQAETHSPDEAFKYAEDFADVLPSEFGNKIAELLGLPQSRAFAFQLISSFSTRCEHGFSTLSYPPIFFLFPLIAELSNNIRRSSVVPALLELRSDRTCWDIASLALMELGLFDEVNFMNGYHSTILNANYALTLYSTKVSRMWLVIRKRMGLRKVSYEFFTVDNSVLLRIRTFILRKISQSVFVR